MRLGGGVFGNGCDCALALPVVVGGHGESTEHDKRGRSENDGDPECSVTEYLPRGVAEERQEQRA